MHKRFFIYGGIWTLALHAVGCGTSISPADPNQAATALTQALDAWKGGQPIEAVDSVAVGEELWSDGWKLHSYEVVDSPAQAGTDLCYQVRLDLESPKGKKVEQNARYTVTTHPRTMVLREVDM